MACNCASRRAISCSCNVAFSPLGAVGRGAGVTSGKPCDEVSVLFSDDEESMCVVDDVRDAVFCCLFCVFHFDCFIFVVRSASRDSLTSRPVLNVAFIVALCLR